MSDAVEVRGTEDISELVRRISRHADKRALRRELTQGINRVTKGTRDDMKASIPSSLPSRGGLASLVHGRTSLVGQAIGGRYAGIRIRVNNKDHNLRRMNSAGIVRHPVFGNRERWISQTEGVEKGFLDESFEKDKPEITRGVQRVMADIARKVEG